MRRRVFVGLVGLVLCLSACEGGSSDASTATTTARHPGSSSDLRRRILREGPVLIKGDDPYWLVVVYWGDFSQTGQLVALYPYIEGHRCLLQPRPHPRGTARDYRNNLSLRDPCDGGQYSAVDLQRYDLSVARDGKVTVDTRHKQNILPPD